MNKMALKTDKTYSGVDKKYLSTEGLGELISSIAVIAANLNSKIAELEDRVRAIENSSIDNVAELYKG